MKAALFFLGAFALIITNNASAEPKKAPIHQRGWIGGEYEVVKVFPAGFTNAPKAALLVTALNTNTPAGLAGVSEGDLILELNHKPARNLGAFRKLVDRSEPGTLLTAKVWHDGQTAERNIRVGRETFENTGMLGFSFIPVFHSVKLWPFASFKSGFSVGFAGYAPEESPRTELTSAEAKYFKSCDSKDYQPTDDGWQVWLVVLWSGTNKHVKSQEVVPLQTGAAPSSAPGNAVAQR